MKYCNLYNKLNCLSAIIYSDNIFIKWINIFFIQENIHLRVNILKLYCYYGYEYNKKSGKSSFLQEMRKEMRGEVKPHLKKVWEVGSCLYLARLSLKGSNKLCQVITLPNRSINNVILRLMITVYSVRKYNKRMTVHIGILIMYYIHVLYICGIVRFLLD